MSECESTCSMCGLSDDDCPQMVAAMALSHALVSEDQHDLFRAYIKASGAHDALGFSLLNVLQRWADEKLSKDGAREDTEKTPDRPCGYCLGAGCLTCDPTTDTPKESE